MPWPNFWDNLGRAGGGVRREDFTAEFAEAAERSSIGCRSSGRPSMAFGLRRVQELMGGQRTGLPTVRDCEEQSDDSSPVP